MKIVLSILLTLSVGLASFAQIQPTKQAIPPPKSTKPQAVESKDPASVAKSTSQKLQKTLGLNDKQKGELYKAIFEHETGIKKVQKLKLTNKEKYNRTLELDQAKTKKFQMIMTKEQYKKYQLTFP